MNVSTVLILIIAFHAQIMIIGFLYKQSLNSHKIIKKELN